MSHIPVPPRPGAKFRVIGAGMCRTGTKTFNQALTILLNGPVHDAAVQSLAGSWHQISMWMKIMNFTPKAKTFAQKKYLQAMLADVLDGYVATVDAPAITLTPEIMALYPDAIVIATTREKTSWWRSMDFMTGIMGNWYMPLVIFWLPKVQMYGWWREAFRKLALWRYGTEVITIDLLKMHNDHLRACVPEHRLHWYDVKEGWEPLCKILNVPVPDVPFPHHNSKDDAMKSYNEVMFWGAFMWAVVLGLLYGLWAYGLAAATYKVPLNMLRSRLCYPTHLNGTITEL